MHSITSHLNERAYIGKIKDKSIVLNSKDKGMPHFHYGKYRVAIPEKNPKTVSDMKYYIDRKYVHKITDDELSDLINFLKSKNKHLANCNNLEVIRTIWSTFQN